MNKGIIDNRKLLHELAVKARNHAYSPYSHAKIGSSLMLENGQMYYGCNVENASYGATICAERNAIFKAVSESSSVKIKEICVVSDAHQPWPPCGMCRQVMTEFSTPETLIYVGNLEGIKKTFKLSELLPEAFTPSFLDKN